MTTTITRRVGAAALGTVTAGLLTFGLVSVASAQDGTDDPTDLGTVESTEEDTPANGSDGATTDEDTTTDDTDEPCGGHEGRGGPGGPRGGEDTTDDTSSTATTSTA